MSTLKKDLQSLAKELKKLIQKVDKLAASAGTAKKAPAKKAPAKKAPAKKAPAKKKAAPKRVAKPAGKKVAAKGKKMSASETIYGIIQNSKSKDGVDSDMLEKMTGFNNQKIRDNIYKLNKRGRIKRVGRGNYVVA